MKKTCYEHWGIECGDGWKHLYGPLIEMCEKEGVQIAQIKEKFGTLRFYTGPCPQHIQKAIDEAEKASETTCEVCGAPGTLSREGWWKVRCEEHR